MSDHVGKRATAEYLNENAPYGAIVKDRGGRSYIHRGEGQWRTNSNYHLFPLRDQPSGYRIKRWSDGWDELEWVS